jgi:hypothetical protein
MENPGIDRHLLRQQRTLNLARRIQILLDPRPLQVALVVAGIFQRYGSLQRQPFEKIRS